MSNQHCRLNVYKLNSETSSKQTPRTAFSILVNDNSIVPLSQGTEHPYQQILRGVPSKYYQNLITSQLSHSYHLGLSYHHSLPGFLPIVSLLLPLPFCSLFSKQQPRVILLKQLRSYLSNPSSELSISVFMPEFFQWPGRLYIVYLPFSLPLTQCFSLVFS